MTVARHLTPNDLKLIAAGARLHRRATGSLERRLRPEERSAFEEGET